MDRTDRATQLQLNGNYKDLRDRLGEMCRVQRIEVACTPMNDSITVEYNNRSPNILKQANNQSNARQLAQIADQE